MKRLAALSLAHPIACLGTLALITLAAVAGLPQLRTDVGYRAFLGAHHPSVVRFDAFLDRFGGGLPMAAVFACDDGAPCRSVFDDDALAMAARVAERLDGAPGVRAVATPATTPIALPTPFGPVPRRAWEDGGPAPDRALLAERARIDPAWARWLVSEDERVGAIAVELASSSSRTAIEAYAALDAALAPEEAHGFVFHRVGGPVEFVVAGGELEAATARLVPVMVALVGLTLVALFRAPAPAAAVLASVGLSVVWTMGLLGWLSRFGWTQNSLTQVLPPLVLVIGVCDGIHLVSRLAAAVLADPPAGPAERRARVLLSTADVAAPCTMTTLTTVAGFLSFATAELESFARFGWLAAAGVMFALIHSFSLLPILLVHMSPSSLHARRASERWQRGLARVVSWPVARARLVVSLSAVALVVSAVGAARLRVDASFEELYGEKSPVVSWARFVSERLRRPDTLEVALELPPGVALAEPSTLRTIADAERALEGIGTLGPARSVVDEIAWMHRLVSGDDPARQRIADTRAQNEALLGAARLLLARDGEDDGLAHWVDASGRSVRISIESGKTPQEVMRRDIAAVDRLLSTGLPEGWSGEATGPLAVVHDMIDAIRSTQLRSFAGAAVSIWLLVAVFLRSLRWATLAMLPTALPVLVTLAVMAALGMALDVGSAMVAAVVLGLAIDDTIHLLDQFRRRRRPGVAAADAMVEAVVHVGRAVITTSVALSLGFGALALSPWKSVAHFGLVSAVAIAAALVSCLALLPALATALGGRGEPTSGTADRT